MTQETPNTVEPTPTPEPTTSQHLQILWNSLNKGVKFAIVVAVVVLIFAIAGSGSNNSNSTPTTQDTTPTTLSLSDQWSSWKQGFLPIVSQTETDYNQTVADLTSADYTASAQDFATLSSDANEWLANANSVDPTINADIRAVAADLNSIASTGLSAMNGGSLSAFETACANFGADTTKMSNDLTKANSTY